MREQIAVIHSFITPINMATDEAIGILKRLSLLFDKIAVVNMFAPSFLCHYPRWEPTRLLIDKGVMYDPNSPHYNSSKKLSENSADLKEMWDLYELTLNKSKSIIDFERGIYGPPAGDMTDYNRASELYFIAQECLSRCIGASINQTDNAVPILPYSKNAIKLKTGKSCHVLNVVLDSIPLPSSKTPWEKIFEFRSDSDVQGDLYGLRTWIHDASKMNLSERELENKLEWQVHQYKKHLDRHRLDTEMGTLENVLTIGAEVIENISKLNLSKAVKSIFSWHNRKTDLLKAELSAPNPEIAFIVKTREQIK